MASMASSEAPKGDSVTDESVQVTKPMQSWVSVAQDKQSLKKYEVEVLTKDGLHSVEIPDDVIQSATPLWEDFLVGKFLDSAPHVAKVYMILNKIWSYGDPSSKTEVFEVNSNMMRFKVRNPKSREHILRRGMWNIAGVPMVVTKWTPKSEEEKQEEDSIPMWVHVKKVPLHMFSWEGLSFVTSPVGFPVRLHPETLACSSFEVAKVFVKVHVTKVLPRAITFSKNGKEFTAKFTYPWLAPRCNLCAKWGHKGEVCMIKKIDQEEKMREATPKSQKSCGSSEKGEGNEGYASTKNDFEKLAGHERVLIDDQENSEKEVEEEVNENWLNVSPGKVGRSPGCATAEKQKDVIISASKFSVLSLDDEEEGEIQEEEKINTQEKTEPEAELPNTELPITHAEELEKTSETDVVQNQLPPRESRNKQNKAEENTAQLSGDNPMAMSTRSSSRKHL